MMPKLLDAICCWSLVIEDTFVTEVFSLLIKYITRYNFYYILVHILNMIKLNKELNK